MLQEGRDINGEDKTQTWGEGVRWWGNRHSLYFTSHSFPTLHTLSLPFLSYPCGLPLLGWAGPCPLPRSFWSPGTEKAPNTGRDLLIQLLSPQEPHSSLTFIVDTTIAVLMSCHQHLYFFLCHLLTCKGKEKHFGNWVAGVLSGGTAQRARAEPYPV